MTETCIYLYDDITAETARSVSGQLRASNPDVIRLRVNCDGGNVLAGMTIYSMLKNHPAKVICEVEGFCASIASVVAMAADEIVMESGAHMMIHNPGIRISGGSTDLRREADNLDAMASQIADIYESRTGVGKDECLAMMADETWLTPDEAVSHGFADSVAGMKRKRAEARFTTERATALGYRNVPAECFARAVANTEEKPMESIEAIATAAGTDAGTVEAWIAANVDRLSAMVREDLDANPDGDPPPADATAGDPPPPPAEEEKPEEDEAAKAKALADIEARAAGNTVLASIAADLKALRSDVDGMKASAKADADARAATAKAEEDSRTEAFLDAEVKAGVIFSTERADAKAVLGTADGKGTYARLYTNRAKRVPIGRTQAGADPARDASAPETFDLSEAEKRQQAALVRTGRYDNKSAAERLIAIRSTH